MRLTRGKNLQYENDRLQALVFIVMIICCMLKQVLMQRPPRYSKWSLILYLLVLVVYVREQVNFIGKSVQQQHF